MIKIKTTIIMSESKVPLWVFFHVTVAVLVAFAWILARKGWLANPFILLFGLGACLSHTLLQAAVSILGPRPPIYLATGVVLVLAEFLLLWMIHTTYNRRLLSNQKGRVI
jgi:Na+/melibiose symporter-like transporter